MFWRSVVGTVVEAILYPTSATVAALPLVDVSPHHKVLEHAAGLLLVDLVGLQGVDDLSRDPLGPWELPLKTCNRLGIRNGVRVIVAVRCGLANRLDFVRL